MTTELIKKKAGALLSRVDVPAFYRKYNWHRDNWYDGFEDIFRLERTLISAAKQGEIRKNHIQEIASWGGHTNVSAIRCYKEPLVLSLYDKNLIAFAIQNNPTSAVTALKKQTYYIGPTYISKVLRFAAPAQYGAIDTRLVRVFGFGDPNNGKLQIINMIAKNGSDGRWAIDQNTWLAEFRTWTEILNYIARVLNMSENSCPHPSQFIQAGLRQPGEWLPADVEMALFSYATHAINTK